MTNTSVTKWLPAALAPYELSALSWLSAIQSTLPVEEHIEGVTYVLRAQVPGVDPTKDVSVSYHDGALRLEIHRTDTRKEKARTEFTYGTYHRTVAVPVELDERSIHASCKDGVLEITAKITAPDEARRTIPIEVSEKTHNGSAKR